MVALGGAGVRKLNKRELFQGGMVLAEQLWKDIGLGVIEEREVQTFSCVFMGYYGQDEGNYL